MFCITLICVDIFTEFGLKWWLRYHLLDITDSKEENATDSVKYDETTIRDFHQKL